MKQFLHTMEDISIYLSRLEKQNSLLFRDIVVLEITSG